MEALERFALQLCAFAAIAGCAEMLLPEGRLKTAAIGLAGLLAAALVADMALQLLSGLTG